MELTCAYAPPLHWWSASLAGISMAIKPRERTRTLIAGGITLTVPIAGGSQAVKRTPVESWQLSDHGKWPHLHFEALRAAYGRTPFFAHIAPKLEAIYASLPKSFCELTLRLNAELLDFMQFHESWPQLLSLRQSEPKLYSALRGERAEQADFGLSVLDAAFRLGPETIFLLAPPL